MCLNAFSILQVVVPPAIEGMPVVAPAVAPVAAIPTVAKKVNKRITDGRRFKVLSEFVKMGGAVPGALIRYSDLTAAQRELIDGSTRQDTRAIVKSGFLIQVTPGRKTGVYRLTEAGIAHVHEYQ